MVVSRSDHSVISQLAGLILRLAGRSLKPNSYSHILLGSGVHGNRLKLGGVGVALEACRMRSAFKCVLGQTTEGCHSSSLQDLETQTRRTHRAVGSAEKQQLRLKNSLKRYHPNHY